jgi:glutamate-1-semialdehyde 2,1-aminomutase
VDEALKARAVEIGERELAILNAKTTKSAALYQRARKSMPLGVASSFHSNDPYPIYVARGKGSRVWDVDGNELVDFHNGFGTMLVGHAHPKIVEAIERAARSGTHFAATTEVAVDLAEELCRRFGLEQVRFANSGTEATMDAIRLARAATGRDVITKIEGSYHGHHDAVMFSVVPNADAVGGRDMPATTPMSLGIPARMAELTTVVPFNDAAALERLFGERGGEIACLIMEPIMMNIGIALPQPGYLEAVREICTKHDVVLIFDEVKSGASVAAGGAAERFGVKPDLSCYAKGIGGGTPVGAFGGRADIMSTIERGAAQQGTFNGNPLGMAAGLAALTQVMTPDAYDHLGKLGTLLAEGTARAIADHSLPACTIDLGAKGCITWRPEPLKDYRDFLDAAVEGYEASWPWMVNRGVFMTPGDEEQWTISVQHDEADIRRYVEAFAELCAELAG